MLQKALYTILVTLQRQKVWLHGPISDSIPGYVQQSSPKPFSGLPEPLEQLLRGPPATGSRAPLLQNPEASAVLRQNCNAAHSSSARARGGGTQNLPNTQPTTQGAPHSHYLGILLGQVSWLIYSKFRQEH